MSRSRKLVTDFALSRVLCCCGWWVDLSTSVVMSSVVSCVYFSETRNIFQLKVNTILTFSLGCGRYLDL